MKKNVKPGTYLAPVPAVMVTCGKGETSNIITLAWVGTVNSEPPIVSISVRYQRHSFRLIEQNGEFTVNLVSKDLVRATDVCGVVSGRNTDKFALTGLTACKGEKVACPYIGESPLSLECKVVNRVDFGTHAVFFGEVVNVIADDTFLDEKGRVSLPANLLAAYVNGTYVGTADALGSYGYTSKEERL
ncbi:MAG: flavin reductase family protein [Clostridia bacterium]|nr:flavin reductase family protein [Clostridia bacterium]